MEKGKFFENKILVVNGIMSIMVVFLHSYNIERYNHLKWFMIPLFENFISKVIGNLAVPTFFFMSSILFFQNYSTEKIWNKYKNRTFSILIPYLLWNTIYFMLFVLLTKIPLSSFFMDTKEIPIDRITIIAAVFGHIYNKSYWFMYQLILFIVISPIIYYLIKNHFGILFLLGVLIINYWIERIPGGTYGIRINSLVYWVMGAYFALHQREKLYNRSKNGKWYLVVSLLLIAIRFYLGFITQKVTVSNYILNLLLLLNVISLWFAFDILRLTAVYEWMKMSFFIYSVHPLIVDTIKKGIAALLPENDIMALTNYIISGVGGILISVLIGKLMIQLAPKLFHILSGGRLKRSKS